MNRDLSVLLTMRKVLAEVGSGAGVAAAVVREFSGAQGSLREVARETLLGHPPQETMPSLLAGEGAELAILASLLAEGSKGDAEAAGSRGEWLSLDLEGWVKAREARAMEQKVMRFRGVIVSAVLGAVLGMVSTIAPAVGSFGFPSSAGGVDIGSLKAAAGVMGVLSSAMLGLFMSGRGLVANVLVTVVAFGLVSLAVQPLATIAVPQAWAIK